MNRAEAKSVEMIPMNLVNVSNPRLRSQRSFHQIVESIGRLGLKRPITVTRKKESTGPRYELVCGQGRFEAYQALGQQMIPAIVVNVGDEDSLLMSLVENIARRKHRAIDLLHDIEGLKRRGYTEEQIARKTDLTSEYVKGIIRLLEKGEIRLLRAVEAGHVPVSIAARIAESEDGQAQEALQLAYEQGHLRGRKLLIAKRLAAVRRRHGKGYAPASTKKEAMSPNTLIKTYRADAEKKRLLVRKAELTRERLMFMVQALRTLFADEGFVTLLRAEGIDTLPRNLADRLRGTRN